MDVVKEIEEIEATQLLSGSDNETDEIGVEIRDETERETLNEPEMVAIVASETDLWNVPKKTAKARERERLDLIKENQRLIRENQSIEVNYSGRRRFKNPADVGAVLRMSNRSCGITRETIEGDLVLPLRERIQLNGDRVCAPPPPLLPREHEPKLAALLHPPLGGCNSRAPKLTLDQFLRRQTVGPDRDMVELKSSAAFQRDREAEREAIQAQQEAVQQLQERLKRSLMRRYLCPGGGGGGASRHTEGASGPPRGCHGNQTEAGGQVRCVRTAGEIDPILSRGVELILGDEERARFTSMSRRDKWIRHRELVLAAARDKSARALLQRETVELEEDTPGDTVEDTADNREREDDDPEWTVEGAAGDSDGDPSDSDCYHTETETGNSSSDSGDESGSDQDSPRTKKRVPVRMTVDSDSDSCSNDRGAVASVAGATDGNDGSFNTDCVAAPDHGTAAVPPGRMISSGDGGSVTRLSSSEGTETAATDTNEAAGSELSVKVSLNETGSDLFPDFNNSGNWRDLSSTGTMSMSSVSVADKSLSASVNSGSGPMRLNHREMFDLGSVQDNHDIGIDNKDENSVIGHGSLGDTVDIDDYLSVDERRNVDEDKDREEEEEEEEAEVELVDEDEEEDQRQRLAAARDMFDEEAELSGSDADQYEDEDETGMDGVDGDEDDLDQEKLPSAGRLRRQIERVHNRLELDRDARDIRYLQELYLEDGELHEFGDQPRRRTWFNDGNNNEGNDKFSEYQVRYRDGYDDNDDDDADNDIRNSDVDESAVSGHQGNDDTAVPVIETEEDQMEGATQNRNSININFCKDAPSVSSVAANMTLEEYMKKLKSEKRNIKRVSLIGKNLPDVSKQLAETCGTSGGFQTLRSRVEQRLFTIIPRSKANSDVNSRKRTGDQASSATPINERQSGPCGKRIRPDNHQKY